MATNTIMEYRYDNSCFNNKSNNRWNIMKNVIKGKYSLPLDRAMLILLIVINMLEAAGIFALLMWMNHTAIYRIGG